MLTIGMFGTCGGSKWRDSMKEQYLEMGIDFFDPNKPNWKREDAQEEAVHLANDEVILFPVTGETYGMGSLSEVGFNILHAIRIDDRRDFVIYVSSELDASLTDNVLRRESLSVRALVIEHLKKLRLKSLYVVDNLEEMFDLSVVLYRAAQMRAPFSKYNPHNRG